MKINYCPVCGKEHIDFDNDIRFRCRYCGAEFSKWEKEFHKELEEAFTTPKKERKEGKAE